MRERITEGLQHDGVVYKYDISLPVQHLYSLVEAMRPRVADLATRCVGFGHLGDGVCQLLLLLLLWLLLCISKVLGCDLPPWRLLRFLLAACFDALFSISRKFAFEHHQPHGERGTFCTD